jgi:hypothetical protein
MSSDGVRVRNRLDSLLSWLSFHRGRVAVAVGVAAVLTAVAFGAVMFRSGNAGPADEPAATQPTTTTVPVDADGVIPGRPRPDSPTVTVPADGPCAVILDALRTLIVEVESGVVLDGDDLVSFNSLNPQIDQQCPAETAASFRVLELDPWLHYKAEAALADK